MNYLLNTGKGHQYIAALALYKDGGFALVRKESISIGILAVLYHFERPPAEHLIHLFPHEILLSENLPFLKLAASMPDYKSVK